jgi:NADPH-dependent curcumin reductase CurA
LSFDSTQSSNRPLTSKAVTYKTLGGYEVIDFLERTVRAPAAGEVRIEVKAAAVNPADLMFRDPGWPNVASNIVPGMDAAGVIESVGPGVSHLHPGQKVIAAVNPVRPEGAQAQHIVVPAASVVPVPEGVSLAQASILLMTGLTALNALQIAALKKGQILAVSGAITAFKSWIPSRVCLRFKCSSTVRHPPRSLWPTDDLYLTGVVQQFRQVLRGQELVFDNNSSDPDPHENRS